VQRKGFGSKASAVCRDVGLTRARDDPQGNDGQWISGLGFQTMTEG
jgi:hypothetical protein